MKEAEQIHPQVAAEQQQQLKEAQIEATIHNMPRPGPVQLLLLWNVAKQLGMASKKDSVQQRDNQLKAKRSTRKTVKTRRSMQIKTRRTRMPRKKKESEEGHW